MPRELMLSPAQSLTVIDATPEAFVVETAYVPHSPEPPAHSHPSQDERFEILAGAVRVRIDGTEQDAATGETIDIPRTAVHQMWNPGDEEARVRWTTTPGGRTLEWFEQVDSIWRDAGPDGPDGERFGRLLGEYADTFVLAPPAG
jgi:quercetin dioxygenase-like cupin family protein